MIVYKKNQIIDRIVKIPEKSGFYKFSDSQKTLYTGITNNLRKSIGKIFFSTSENKNIFQLVSLTQNVAFETTTTFFAALLREKEFSENRHLEFNKILQTYSDYVYLGLDFHKTPYFKICENTQGNHYYIGPFTDRFFLQDFIFAMAELFGFPSCENEEYPCEKIKNKTCKGYCVLDSSNVSEIIRKHYIGMDKRLLEKLQQDIEQKLNELKFSEAENIKKLQKIILKYYENLKFLRATKKLSCNFKYHNRDILVQNGLISRITSNKDNIPIDSISISYRDNELLAANKEELLERIIIYRFLKQRFRIEIDKIYSKSISTTDFNEINMNSEIK